MLTRAPRTEAELEERLVARGYQRATAAATVARCRELGYVGDEAYARERARALRARGWGSLRIVADLGARGLPSDLVDAAVEGSRYAARVRISKRIGNSSWSAQRSIRSGARTQPQQKTSTSSG